MKKNQFTSKGCLSVTNCCFLSYYSDSILFRFVSDFAWLEPQGDVLFERVMRSFVTAARPRPSWYVAQYIIKITQLDYKTTQFFFKLLDRWAAIFPQNDNDKPLNSETIFEWVHLRSLIHASFIVTQITEGSLDHYVKWRFSPYLSIELSVSVFRYCYFFVHPSIS